MESRIWTGIPRDFLVALAPRVLGEGGCFLDGAAGGSWSYLGVPRHGIVFSPTRATRYGTGRDLGAAEAVFAAALTPAPNPAPRSPGQPPFRGGWMGYLGYGAGAWFDRIPPEADGPGPPTGALFWADPVLALDHTRGELHLLASGRDDAGSAPSSRAAAARLAEGSRLIEAALADPAPPVSPALAAPGAPVSLPPRAPFLRAVRSARDAIGRGDVFQVNLAQRFDLGAGGDPWAWYHALRRRNPAPYAGVVRVGGYHVLSASPELLVEVAGGVATSKPIAGTHPRGAGAAADAALGRALRRHPKERAEHVMMVDLVRNDLGRVSAYGGVRVRELLDVESYASVHHLVSTVEGRLRPGVHPAEVLAAVFPGGTITGAPKIRATELIRDLEAGPRGPYTGSLGFVDCDGEQTWNIAIRTMVTGGGAAWMHAGAGVVWDSLPAREYRETVQKAAPFLELAGLDPGDAGLGQVDGEDADREPVDGEGPGAGDR